MKSYGKKLVKNYLKGYKLVTKPVKIIKAPERDTGSLRKANFDVGITYFIQPLLLMEKRKHLIFWRHIIFQSQ